MLQTTLRRGIPTTGPRAGTNGRRVPAHGRLLYNYGSASDLFSDFPMPRIKIELPERFSFAIEIPVQALHINGAGHVDNAQMVVLISGAREAYFVGLGYNQNNVEGLGTVITDAAFQYMSEAFEGETLVFRLAANDFNKYGGDIVCRVSERESGREVARAKLGFVFFDYTTRKVAPIPPRFLERVAAA